MERIQKNINKKIAKFLIKFKDDIKEKINTLNLNEEKAENLLKFMYDYERLSVEKSDLQKKNGSKWVDISLYRPTLINWKTSKSRVIRHLNF